MKELLLEFTHFYMIIKQPREFEENRFTMRWKADFNTSLNQ